MKKKSKPSENKSAPANKVGGQPENDKDAREAGMESATSSREDGKRTKK